MYHVTQRSHWFQKVCFAGVRRLRINDKLFSDRILSLIDWSVSLLSAAVEFRTRRFTDDLHSQHWGVSFPLLP